MAHVNGPQWASIPAMTMGGGPLTGMTASQAIVDTYAAKVRRTPSKWQRMLWTAKKGPKRDLPEKAKQYYSGIRPSHLIEVFGNWNPLYGGKPKRTVMALLNAAPSHTTFAYEYVRAGLAFKIPCIPGRRRTSMRLSMGGLMLLDHWAEKHPRFAAFVDAYVTDKARREILEACVDLDFGQLPEVITTAIAKSDAALEKMYEAQAKARAAEQATLAQQQHYQHIYAQQLQQHMSRWQANIASRQKAMGVYQTTDTTSGGAWTENSIGLSSTQMADLAQKNPGMLAKIIGRMFK